VHEDEEEDVRLVRPEPALLLLALLKGLKKKGGREKGRGRNDME
jgi:hypothetical protein